MKRMSMVKFSILLFLCMGYTYAISPDELIAYGSKNYSFFRINMEDGSTRTIDCPITHLQLAFSPDGTLYATSRATDSLYRFSDPENGTLEYLCPLPGDSTGGDVTVSPDGKGVYFTIGWTSKELFRYDVDNSAIDSLGLITGADSDIYGLAFSPDGVLYGTTGTGSGDKRLYVIDTITLQATAVGPAFFGTQMDPDGSSSGLDFAPDGKLYASIEPIAVSLPGSEKYLSTINPYTGIAFIDYNKRILGGIDSFAITTVPEPATLLLVGIGAVTIRKRK